jgi:NADH-ubiquinone oxidoreductase chain 6
MFNLIHVSDLYNGFSISFIFIVSIVSIFSGIFTIITKNPIISVLYLILLFSSISCYLIFIGIVFIGISYLLVYVGAVSILFLFILMLINIRISELVSDTNNNIPLAILTVLTFFIPFSNLGNESSLRVLRGEYVSYVSSNNWDGSLVNITDITSIGNIMYTSYSMWLVITSIILLLAMVGSIVITIKQRF